MKILLTTLNAKFVHSSLALRYLKAYCEKDFPEIKILEYTINDVENHIIGELYKEKAQVIAFSCYIWNIEESLRIAETLKKVSPETLILFGGPEVSYDPKEIMIANPFIDFLIYGEGEESLQELLWAVRKGQSFEAIKGLVYRHENEVMVGEPRPLLQNLDSIPTPYEGDLSELKNKIAYIETSRGCPFQCQYCLSSTIHGIRYFSMERTQRELRKLIQADVNQVKFVDRTFNCSKKRAMEIFGFLYQEQPEDMNFHFEIAADLMDAEMIKYLEKIPRGLFQFEIGVQSTNPETIELIQRKMNFDKVREVVKGLRDKNNMHLHLDLIAGLPKENWDSFRKSFNDVYNLNPHKLQLGFLKLLKGSGIRERAEAYDYKYVAFPPYEVLAHKDLSYDEILKLKNIEELVDMYLNSYRFGFSLPYIIGKFRSPFDFYYELSLYWEEQGLFQVAHNQVTLYEILGGFFAKLYPEEFSLFKDILKLDYLLQGKMRNLPEYFGLEEDKEVKEKFYDFLRNPENVENYLPDLKNLYPKQLGKLLKLGIFKYDLMSLLEGKEVFEGKTVLVFNYENRDRIFQRAQFFKLPI